MDRFLALRIFNAVVEEESLIGASRKLALSPSAISKNLAALEEELGARLLNRTTRRVSLTEAGEAYYERTARLLADLDEADGVVSRMEGAPRGLLRVSAPISFGQRHLAPALPDFRAQHPEVAVQMFLEDRVVDLVAERFDLAIRIANLRDSSLVARKLASNHRKIYAAPDYIARRGLPGLQGGRRLHDGLTAALGGDGRFWFITTGGLMQVEPQGLTMNRLAPPVVIRNVTARGVSYDASKPVVL
ncbi:MAG: LysR family transcriptional regulator, partial [Oceanibaculum sp.]